MQVEFRDINKFFGPVHANKNISLTIPVGCIFGLLGENGAGKSTLMKILSGFISQTSGDVILDGNIVGIDQPGDAIKFGIGMLHQDPLDFPPMTIIDNFVLGQTNAKSLLPKRKAALKAFREMQAGFNFHLDPDEYVDVLTVGERQQLEIIRLLWLGAEVLILDEPTTGISAPQKVELFAALNKLAQDGKTIILVTHKLEEVQDLCHYAAILRQGELVGIETPPFDNQILVEKMFGKAISLPPKETAVNETPILKLSNIAFEDSRLQISDINLTVHAGETIGLAGIEGSGQDVFLQLCAGLVRPVSGSIILDDRDITGARYHSFLANEIRYLPANRMEMGLIQGLTITEHFALLAEEQGLFVNQKLAETVADEHIAEFNIKGRPESTVESLSGGNQQRTLSAMFDGNLKLFLLENPTRGLDVESQIWLWRRLKQRAKEYGTALIFTSADLEEIQHYSDRILVFFSGQVFGPIDASQTDVKQLGQLIGGVQIAQVTA